MIPKAFGRGRNGDEERFQEAKRMPSDLRALIIRIRHVVRGKGKLWK